MQCNVEPGSDEAGMSLGFRAAWYLIAIAFSIGFVLGARFMAWRQAPPMAPPSHDKASQCCVTYTFLRNHATPRFQVLGPLEHG